MPKRIKASMPRASNPKPAVDKAVKKKASKLREHGGYCCPVLHLAVSRANDNTRVGISTGTMFAPTGKRLKARIAVVIYFPKAKRGDTSKYGHGTPFANSTYAECDFCPFCGAALTEKAKEARADALSAATETAAAP